MGIVRFFLKYIAIGIVLAAGFVLYKAHIQPNAAPHPITGCAFK